MTQDTLNDLFVSAQFIQIRRDAATEPVQAVPVDVETLGDRTNIPENQLIDIQVLARARVKHHTRLRVADGASIRIQNFRQLPNDRNRLCAYTCLGLVDDCLPYRAFHVQGVA